MRRPRLATLLLALVACAQQTPQANVSPLVSPATPVAVACKLPIGIMGGVSGFMSYPDGAFTADPTSDLSHSAYHGSNASSIGFGPVFDRKHDRWLPVPRPLVAPDGATYVYAELVFPPPPSPQTGPIGPGGSRLHVVDVASASDRVVLDTHEFWEALAYTGSRVFLSRPCIECGLGDRGLWTFDVATSEIRQLTAAADDGSSSWRLIATNAAWSADANGGLTRLDLKTGTQATWLLVPGKLLWPIGVDAAGSTIVEGEADYNVPGATRGGAWLVRGPDDSVQIAPDSMLIDDAVGDGRGIWLLSLGTVYLWRAGHDLTQVGVIPPTTAASSLGGPCR